MSRWTYSNREGYIEDVPELVMFGSDEIRKALPLSDHAHPGCYEFVWIERGQAGWELDETVYTTTAGEMFHTKPGEKHRGSHEVIEPSKFWWLIVEAPELRNDWLRLTSGERLSFEQILQPLPRTAVIGMAPLEPFRRLQRHIRAGGGQLHSAGVRQAIVELLLLFVQVEGSTVPPLVGVEGRFREMLTRIERDPEWRPAVRELADSVEMSESHFYRAFQAHTGLSPMTYIERMRIREACRRLSGSSVSITELAFELGYPSSQHFATVFKRFIGTPPTQWRNKQR